MHCYNCYNNSNTVFTLSQFGSESAVAEQIMTSDLHMTSCEIQQVLTGKRSAFEDLPLSLTNVSKAAFF